MTINIADNTPRVSYNVAQGVTQSSFTVSFEFFDDEDLNVYVDGTLKTLTTDYTVSGGDGSTGSVSISVTGASGGSTVVITRAIELERTTDFPASGAFQIDSLNTELDRFTAIAADLDDSATRGLRLKDQDDAVSTELPLKADRTGRVLAFNATTGVPEAGPEIADVSSIADITADIATLADIEDGTDATDAIQTVSGISANVTTVAGVSSDVSTVAGISADVTTVAGDATDIATVASDSADIQTLADISSDITTAAGISANITTVAGDSTDIQALADVTTEIGLLGTADAIADMNTLATSAIVTDMDALADLNAEIDALGDVTADITTVAGIEANVTTVAGISANTTTVAGIASDVTTVAGISANTTTVAGISANVTTVAGISSDVTTVAGDSADISTVAGVSTEIGRLGTADAVADMNTLGTADVVADMNTLGTAAIVADMGTLADISANITTVAGISSDVTTVAGDAADISTVAGISSDVSTVATNNANVTTVASNITGVNSFGERYRVGASDPTTSLDEGDLAYNSTDNALKYYNGTAWASITAGLTDIVGDASPQLGGDLDLNSSDITGTGDINITGTVTADGLTVDGSVDVNDSNLNITSNAVNINLYENDTTDVNTRIRQSAGDLFIQTLGDTSGVTNRINLDHATGDISFYASNGTTQGLFWDASTERLGLGATSPSATLTVGEPNATAVSFVSNPVANFGGGVAFDAGSGNDIQLINYRTSNMQFGTGGTVDMTIDSSGNVGIGTTAASSFSSDANNLVVGSGSGNEGITINSGSSGNGAIRFADGTVGDNAYRGQVDYDHANDRLMFATAAAERMRIDSSGNVGIGTTSPSSKLHINTQTYGEALRFQASSETSGYYTVGMATGAGLAFSRDGTERMRIHNDGNVGINTDSPSHELTVSAANDSGVRIDAEGNNVALMLTDETTSNGFRFNYNAPSDILSFDTTNGTGTKVAERMRIDSSGNLLVGKTDTSTASQGCVLGAGGLTSFNRDDNVVIRVRRDGTNGEGIEFYNDSSKVGSISLGASGTTYNTTSDIRLKTDIAPIADATDKLMAMNAVTHKWKADPDADAVVGFIAQEMQEIVPEAVSKGEGEDDMWSMDYGRITPVLVAALQDAHRKIEQLEQRINEMETE